MDFFNLDLKLFCCYLVQPWQQNNVSYENEKHKSCKILKHFVVLEFFIEGFYYKENPQCTLKNMKIISKNFKK